MKRPGLALIPLVLILVAVLAVGTVAYVAFVQPDDVDYTNTTTITTNTYSNTNSYTNSAANTNSATAGWQTYTNSTEGLAFQYPANQYTTPETRGTSYVRVQNYDKNKETPSLAVDEWYAEMVITTLAGSEPCGLGYVRQQTATFGTMNGIRGQIEALGDAGGSRYGACVERNAQRYILNVTVHPDNTTTANAIIDTFTFTN